MQKVFFAAPHRVMFLAGVVQALLAVLWWAGVLALRLAPDGAAAGFAPSGPWPPIWVHAALMIYGVFPFFIFGFVMTAMPRWQGAAGVSARSYVPAFAFMSGGWLMFYASLWLPPLLGPAIVLVLLGWLVGLVDALRVLRHDNPDRRHAFVVFVALCAGALGLAALAAFAFGAPPVLVVWAQTIGIWWLLLPIFVTVCHRMIPFFSASVLPKYVMVRPYWALYLILCASIGHGVLVMLGLPQWLWLTDAPAATTALWLTARWQLRRSFAVRLLAMLHVGFIWLGVALALQATQSAALLAGHVVLGLAPLHALAIGFFATLLIGMVSRVTLGHSGRTLAADRLTWLIFLAIQAVALARVAAELAGGSWMNPLLLAASLGWLAVFATWFVKFAPAYWRPRTDGRPG